MVFYGYQKLIKFTETFKYLTTIWKSILDRDRDIANKKKTLIISCRVWAIRRKFMDEVPWGGILFKVIFVFNGGVIRIWFF